MSRLLFAGHAAGSRPMNRKENASNDKVIYCGIWINPTASSLKLFLNNKLFLLFSFQFCHVQNSFETAEKNINKTAKFSKAKNVTDSSKEGEGGMGKVVRGTPRIKTSVKFSHRFRYSTRYMWLSNSDCPIQTN